MLDSHGEDESEFANSESSETHKAGITSGKIARTVHKNKETQQHKSTCLVEHIKI